MRRAEVVALLKEVGAYCPAQQFDQFTVEVWVRDLTPFASRFVEQAARELLAAPRDGTDRPRYLHLGDLLARSKAIARRATDRVNFPEPPPAASTPEAREQWSLDRLRARNTGDVETFLRKWYGVSKLAEITRGEG